MKLKKILKHHIAERLSLALGIVLIWRGLWYALDELDLALFGGSHSMTAIGGIILGVLILYLPDKDLKELV